jgi:hypothetical protein
MIRWLLERKISPIPKSVTPARIKENFEVAIHRPFLQVYSVF